ncbi:MAG: cytochrome c oxidase subunit II [Anaerolineales bacterium]|nr:cytochrome c oxidase subunit II [Anaerolineales bacterium]
MRERNIFILTIIALVLVGLGFAASAGVNLMPTQAAERAEIVDQLFRVMIGVATVIFLIVEGALIYAVFRFRAEEGDESDAAPVHGNVGLEIVWTLIPAVIVVVIGVYAFRVLSAVEAPSSNEMIVEVTGRQFSWEFNYPEQDLTSSELHLVVGRPVRFEITSEDVIHSFWIPAFRAKQDATPGQISELVVTPNREGTYAARCAELCGAGHADMVTQVVVESEGDFEAWVQELTSLPEDPTEAGRFVFDNYGCAACHTLEDVGATGTVGPELDGIGERAAARVEGLSAEEYLRESIVDPNAHIVEGFDAGVMPQDFGERMRSEELDALVNYLLNQ